ncbi:MAG: hypothetical protein HFJ12_04880 [Bacilli bacterium]|nr:hypothetical protein [Bacilli bacterium]
MYSIIEQNLKNIDMINFGNDDKIVYSNVLLQINKLIIDLMIKHEVSYNYQYLNNRVKSLKLYNGSLLEEDEENDIIQICQYNQLGEKLTDEDEIINLIHEYLHRVSFRNYKDECDIGNLYYGFDEFCTEFITSMICMKLGLNYEIYYRQHSAGYIDNSDYEFMKKLSKIVGINTLLEIYFTGDKDLLEQTLGMDLLMNMNKYIDYYQEIYDSFNKPRKVVNEILDKPIFGPQRQILNSFINKINTDIKSKFNNQETFGSVKK